MAMRFLIEPVYCMTWIWTLHNSHNKLKSSIEEDNIWATVADADAATITASVYSVADRLIGA